MTASSTTNQPLAILGGLPVRQRLLPYGRQSIEEEDIRAVVDVLRSDWLTTGPKVGEFEEAFSAWVGAKYAVSFSSGTGALHGAAFAAGLKAGDEVITSPMTFVATANSILYQGARPVLADVCADTLNIDPDQISGHITSKTRALLPVDYGGHPADLDPILEHARLHGLKVIEDGCHALGAEYRGRRTGRISDMTIFSFHPVKHLATGEGGMVTTEDPKLANSLRCFRSQGISREAWQQAAFGQWYYEMVVLGFNYRLTDIACALGLSQLKRLESNLGRRRSLADAYSHAFANMTTLQPPSVRNDVNPAWHLYPLRLNPKALRIDRAGFVRALRAENIGANVHYIPVHYHPYYRDLGFRKGQYPVTEEAYDQLISLPMFHGMSAEDAEDVIEAVRKIATFYSS